MGNIPSTAAQIIIAVIPIVGIVMGSVVVFLWIIFNYKTKKILIEKGLYRAISFDLDSFSLFSGLLLLPIGLSLMLFFVIKQGAGYGVLSGLIPFAVGLGLMLFTLLRSRILSKRG